MSEQTTTAPLVTDEKIMRMALVFADESNEEGLKMTPPMRITAAMLMLRDDFYERRVAALLRERDEAVRLLGHITGQVRTLPGNTEIGFDFVMLLKRIDGFLSTQGSNTETTHPSPQSDTLTDPLPLSMTEEPVLTVADAMEAYAVWQDDEYETGLNAGEVDRLKSRVELFSTHTKTITVERTFTESEVRAMMDDVKSIAADHSIKCYTNRINQMTPPAPVAFHIDNYLWKSHGLSSDPT